MTRRKARREWQKWVRYNRKYPWYLADGTVMIFIQGSWTGERTSPDDIQ